jgi:hypothetical protein
MHGHGVTLPRVLLVLLAVSAVTGCRRSPPTVTNKTTTPAATPDGGRVPHWQFDTPAAALREVLRRTTPRVVGVGEYHQKTRTVNVRSAVRRFAEQMLPAIGAETSDLIIETWVTEGRCGDDEKRVVKNVEKTTERPAATEDEVLTLLKRAKQLGVQPHILKVNCADYKLLLDGGKVDYDKLLSMITRHLRRTATQILAARAKPSGHDAGLAGSRRMVVLYGGALHNDLYPVEGLEGYSYAEALQKQSGDRYVELDLYVPELIEGDKTLSAEPWYPLLRLASPTRVLLIERGEGSFILVLQRGQRS